ncbi:MAG: protein-disulfide reductase DsbD domain-containing protein, partial [Planctomycetota bacterium]
MDSHPTSTTLAAILVGIAASTGSAAPPTSSAVGFDGEGDLGPAVPMLISEFRSLTPGGANAIAVSFDLEPGWHVYWPGQNTTGFPVDIILSLPEGISAGEEIWPTPERYELPGGILDHTFEDQVTVIIPIEVDERVESGRRVTIEAELDWLVCKDACLPGGAI